MRPIVECMGEVFLTQQMADDLESLALSRGVSVEQLVAHAVAEHLAGRPLPAPRAHVDLAPEAPV